MALTSAGTRRRARRSAPPERFTNTTAEPCIPQELPPSGGSVQRGLFDAAGISAADQLRMGAGGRFPF